MKAFWNQLLLFSFILAGSLLIQSEPVDAATKVVTSDGYKLTIEYQDDSLLPCVQAAERTFKSTYSKMAKEFSPNVAPKEVIIKFEQYEDYPNGYAIGNTIYLNPEWIKKYNYYQGLVVHELFHVVDAYPHGAEPIWFQEGMADYARFRYSSIDGWRFTPVTSSQKYTDSYRVTGRFFTWINHYKAKGSLLKIHQETQNNRYSDELFKKYTGKTLDQLWSEYQDNPGNVEGLDRVFANNKIRYNHEAGTGKWKQYDEIAFVPGKNNYINLYNASSKTQKVSIAFVRKSDGKTVTTLTNDINANSRVHYDPLSKYNFPLKKETYMIKVKHPSGSLLDFEINYGNKFY